MGSGIISGRVQFVDDSKIFDVTNLPRFTREEGGGGGGWEYSLLLQYVIFTGKFLGDHFRSCKKKIGYHLGSGIISGRV